MPKETRNTASPQSIHTQILIIGAGPAGLTAAKLLRKSGYSVLVVDENATLGGQYYRQPPENMQGLAKSFRKNGRKLVESVRNNGAVILTSSYLFAVDDDGTSLYIFDENSNQILNIICETTIIATGSYELVIPYLGWEQPKCITPGMASRIFGIDYANPNQSIVLGGSGPFLLSVASHLVTLGANVKAVVEYHTPYIPRPNSFQLLLYPTRLFEFFQYRWTLWRHNVEIYQNYQIQEVAQTSNNLRSIFKSRNSNTTLEFFSDYVAISYGFIPTTEASSLLGINLNEGEIHRSAQLDAFGRTDKDNIYVIGESVNIQGWRAAVLRGKLAAVDIISRNNQSGLRARLQKLLGRVRSQYESYFALIRRAIFCEQQAFEMQLYDELLVCRCESVKYREIAKYLDQPWNLVSGLKAETRVGMGTCQGKQCSYALGKICSNNLKRSNENENFMNSRAPLRPIPVSALIQLRDRTALVDH